MCRILYNFVDVVDPFLSYLCTEIVFHQEEEIEFMVSWLQARDLGIGTRCSNLTTSAPTASPTASPSTSPFDEDSTSHVSVEATLSTDMSELTASVRATLETAMAAACGVPRSRLVATYTPGSVMMSVKIYEHASVSLAAISKAVSSNFGNAAAFRSFIMSATGVPTAVSGFATASTVQQSTSDDGGSDAILFGQNVFVVAGVSVGLIVVLGLAVVVLCVCNRRPKAAPQIFPETHTSDTRT